MIDKKYLAEVIGTFIFALGINMSTLYTSNSQLPNLFSIISSLFVGITISRKMSGGHVNGAVSFGVFYETKDVKEWVYYFISQNVGASLACFLSWLIYHKHILMFANPAYSLKGIFIAELMATFIFVYNILTQSHNRFSKNESISTLLIVLGLYTAVNITSILSSGCVNPSLATSFILTRMFLVGISDFEFAQYMMYVIGEFAGALLAAWLYNAHFKREVDVDVQSNKEVTSINEGQ